MLSSIAAALILAVGLFGLSLGACDGLGNSTSTAHAKDPPSYRALATRSARMLETTFYNGLGLWRMCDPAICNTKNRDWGADALTNLLSFRWLISYDRSVLPVLRTLTQTARYWAPGEPASSDSVMWDAVAEARLYQATGSKVALAKAEAALKWLR